MEQSGGGQIAARLAKPCRDGGEDRLSALPDEVLVLILEGLDTTAEAARTSVLARRWRGLWRRLSKLRFKLHPDGDRICELIDAADAPELRYISVTTNGATADSATAWLPAAARRLSGGLVYHDIPLDLEDTDEEEEKAIDDDEEEEEREPRRAGNVQLPCFENATTIELRLRFLGIALPSEGVFTRLTDLELRCLTIGDPRELGDLVSSPRCPCLQKLTLSYTLALPNPLSIHSESLLQINLMGCCLMQLTMVTPLLQKLSVDRSFPPAIPAEQQRANITAPQMVSLVWMDQYDPRFFHLGQPRELQTDNFYVYGVEACRESNHTCLKLLQQFKVLYSLRLPLVYSKQDIWQYRYQYLMGDMTALPQITFLHLDVWSHGHAFGASVFHLLRLCIGLKRLSLLLYGRRIKLGAEQPACPSPSGCFCDQPRNWKTDELVLDHLEDVRIIGLEGAEHEVDFLQWFLSRAIVLKSLRMAFVNEMDESKIVEFRQALAGSFSPETCVQFETIASK